MAREQPIELFMPPNMLKAKVGGGGFSGLDMAAIKRAEAAMEEHQERIRRLGRRRCGKADGGARRAIAKTPDARVAGRAAARGA